jgi:hypothetical protein
MCTPDVTVRAENCLLRGYVVHSLQASTAFTNVGVDTVVRGLVEHRREGFQGGAALPCPDLGLRTSQRLMIAAHKIEPTTTVMMLFFIPLPFIIV